MSLRMFHLVFMTLVIIGADLIGAWAIRNYSETHDPSILLCGIVTLIGGFGLVGYVIWFVRKTEKAHLV